MFVRNCVMFIVRINVDCVTLQDLSCGLVCFLGRPRRRWEENITMDLQEVGWGAWTGLIWLRIGTGGGLL